MRIQITNEWGQKETTNLNYLISGEVYRPDNELSECKQKIENLVVYLTKLTTFMISKGLILEEDLDKLFDTSFGETYQIIK